MITSYELFKTYVDLILLIIVLGFVCNMVDDAFKLRKFKRESIATVQKNISKRIIKMNNRKR